METKRMGQIWHKSVSLALIVDDAWIQCMFNGHTKSKSVSSKIVERVCRWHASFPHQKLSTGSSTILWADLLKFSFLSLSLAHILKSILAKSTFMWGNTSSEMGCRAPTQHWPFGEVSASQKSETTRKITIHIGKHINIGFFEMCVRSKGRNRPLWFIILTCFVFIYSRKLSLLQLGSNQVAENKYIHSAQTHTINRNRFANQNHFQITFEWASSANLNRIQIHLKLCHLIRPSDD